MIRLNSAAKDLTAWINDNVVEAFLNILINKNNKKYFAFSSITATNKILNKQVKLRRFLNKFEYLCGPVS